MSGVLTRESPLTPQRSAPVDRHGRAADPGLRRVLRRSSERSRALPRRGRHVVVETSRGCWWGAKHHCTFCGLNGDTMAFRSKSPERAFDEIAAPGAQARHSTRSAASTTSSTCATSTRCSRCSRDSGLELELFYEVKANLRHDQLASSTRGGIRQIQPGIESFCNRVLKLMDKGVSGAAEHPADALVRGARHRLRLEHPRRLPGRAAGGVRADGRAHPAARCTSTRRCRPRGCGSTASARSTPAPQALRLPPRAPVARVLLRVPARSPRAEPARLLLRLRLRRTTRLPETYTEPLRQAVGGVVAAPADPELRPRLDARDRRRRRS